MQPMDEQPSGQPIDQQAMKDPLKREKREEQVPGSIQEPQLAERMSRGEPGQTGLEPQRNDYRGASEQIPFAYPPTAAPYAPGATRPLQPEGPSRPVPPPGAAWTYPPQPEHYQAGSQPFGAAIPAQFGQTTGASPAVPLGSSYQAAAPVGMGPQRRSGLRTGAILALVALLTLVFGTGLFAGWQFGRTSFPAASPTSFQPGNNSTVNVPQLTSNNADAVREAVINKVRPGVVQVDVINAAQHSLGSGVIIDGRGYIVTNNHVVANASSIQVTLADGSTQLAHMVGGDPADDLAIIQITPPSSGLGVITLADSSQVHVGQSVLAIGSPLGNAQTVTSGIISALTRTISEGQSGPTIPDAIQTDAPINPGNSGGALVDLQGNLIGIPTLNAIDTEFNTPANGLGFAIPSNRVKFIAEQVITNGRVSHTGRSILGVSVTTVTQNVATRNHLGVNYGVLIESVTAGGPAASAGLKANDVIVGLAGKTVHNTSDLTRALLQHSPGETVKVTVSRGNQQLTLNATLSELPPG